MSKIDFKLRVFTIDDIDSIVENANNINVAKNLHDRFPFPYTLQDAREFIEIFLPNLEGKVFAIDVEGKAVGTIGLHFQADEYRMNAELGYWLGEKYWNNGIITSAIEKVVVYGFEILTYKRFTLKYIHITGVLLWFLKKTVLSRKPALSITLLKMVL